MTMGTVVEDLVKLEREAGVSGLGEAGVKAVAEGLRLSLQYEPGRGASKALEAVEKLVRTGTGGPELAQAMGLARGGYEREYLAAMIKMPRYSRLEPGELLVSRYQVNLAAQELWQREHGTPWGHSLARPVRGGGWMVPAFEGVSADGAQKLRRSSHPGFHTMLIFAQEPAARGYVERSLAELAKNMVDPKKVVGSGVYEWPSSPERHDRLGFRKVEDQILDQEKEARPAWKQLTRFVEGLRELEGRGRGQRLPFAAQVCMAGNRVRAAFQVGGALDVDQGSAVLESIARELETASRRGASWAPLATLKSEAMAHTKVAFLAAYLGTTEAKVQQSAIKGLGDLARLERLETREHSTPAAMPGHGY